MIILLFFSYDHHRFYELKNKVKASTYLAASMIQQIGNSRANKQLTVADISNISYACCLNFFHTNTMFYPWPFKVFFSMCGQWVKRIDENNYRYRIIWGTTEKSYSTSPNTMQGLICSIEDASLSEVKGIHPDLVCDKDGDERLLITCAYRKSSDSDKTNLGFFILQPKCSYNPIYATDTQALFEYELVITPKPGLFLDT